MTRLAIALVPLLLTAGAAAAHGLHPPAAGAAAHDAAHWALHVGTLLVAIVIGAGVAALLLRGGRP